MAILIRVSIPLVLRMGLLALCICTAPASVLRIRSIFSSLLRPVMDRTPDPLSLPAVADVTPGFKGGNPFTVIDHEPKEYPSLDIWPHQITFNERRTLAFPKGSEPDPVVSVDRRSVEIVVGELTALRAVNIRRLDMFPIKPFPRLEPSRLDIATPEVFPSFASLEATNPQVSSPCPGLKNFTVSDSKLSPILEENIFEFPEKCPQLASVSPPRIHSLTTSGAPTGVSPNYPCLFTHEPPADQPNRFRLQSIIRNPAPTTEDQRGKSTFEPSNCSSSTLCDLLDSPEDSEVYSSTETLRPGGRARESFLRRMGDILKKRREWIRAGRCITGGTEQMSEGL